MTPQEIRTAINLLISEIQDELNPDLQHLTAQWRMGATPDLSQADHMASGDESQMIRRIYALIAVLPEP